MIKLGDVVKDRLTGFSGVAVSRIEYLNGCIQYEVQPEGLGKDGVPVKALWFDAQRLTEKRPARRPGGPPPTSLPTYSRPG